MEKRIVQLVPMDPADYPLWAAAQNEDYAAEKVRSGSWEVDGALERARSEFAQLLPQGLDTPLHDILSIVPASKGDSDHISVGVLWVGRGPFVRSLDRAWVFDITIDEDKRGQGYGRAAMVALETHARERGVKEIGLHVFGRNAVAARLYESLGYEVTDISMSRRLG